MVEQFEDDRMCAEDAVPAGPVGNPADELVELLANLYQAQALLRSHDGAALVVAGESGSPELVLKFKEAAVAVRHALEVVLEHVRALHLVASWPLSPTFPNGDLAPNRLTAKQVYYLAGTAAQHAVPDPRNPVDGPGRDCEETTMSGARCRQKALRWIARPICRTHATEEERESNQESAEQHADVQSQMVWTFLENGFHCDTTLIRQHGEVGYR